MTLFLFFFEYVCIEIKEDIENMKLMHVVSMMKRKVTKEKLSFSLLFLAHFPHHLTLQLERLVKRI